MKTCALMLAVAFLLAGCGRHTLGPKALAQEATSLQAVAAESGDLASMSAGGRSTKVFTREHAADLRKAAQASLTALGLTTTSRARALTRLAAALAADLRRLSSSGSDRALQQRLAVRFNRDAAAAQRLAQP